MAKKKGKRPPSTGTKSGLSPRMVRERKLGGSRGRKAGSQKG